MSVHDVVLRGVGVDVKSNGPWPFGSPDKRGSLLDSVLLQARRLRNAMDELESSLGTVLLPKTGSQIDELKQVLTGISESALSSTRGL